MISQLQAASYNPTALRVINTARKLFMQRGYSAVSVNDIVQAAEITKPTLYYHFTDKEELFVQMALQMLEEMYTAMQSALEGQEGARARLTALAAMLLPASGSDTRMMRNEAREHLSAAQQQRLGEAFNRQMFEPLRDEMQQGIDRGEIGRYSAAELAMLFLGMVEAFRHHSDSSAALRAGREVSVSEFAPETVVDLFLYGVGKS